MKKVPRLLLVVALFIAAVVILVPADQADAQGDATVVINAFRVNLRTGPGVQYAVIGELDGGETFAVEAISPDRIWFKVRGTAFGTGWVRGRFTAFRGDINSLAVDEGPYGAEAIDTFIVHINIPAYGSPGGEVVGTILGGGREYVAIGRSFDGIWIQIDTTDGPIWAQSSSGAFRGLWFDLPITFGLEGGVVFGPDQNIAIVNAYRLNLRTGPGVEYVSIGELEGGDEFVVEAISPDRIWFKISGTSFGTGWVRGRHILFRGDISEVAIDEGPYGDIQVATFYLVVFVPVYDEPNGEVLGLLQGPGEYVVTGRDFVGGWIRLETAAYGDVWTEYSRGFFRGVYFDVPIIFP